MDRREMETRTRQFALRVMRLSEALPQNTAGWAICKQLVRAGTSVGANYRASGRARSDAEFLAKLGIVEEEADETCYWLELIIDAKLIKPALVTSLLEEANELVAMIVTMRKSVKKRIGR